VRGGDVVVIGDTPADVACGRGIGARAIGVATGRYEAPALAAHDPSGVAIAGNAKYTENAKTMMVGQGLWTTAGAAKLTRSLVDLKLCTTMTEVVLPSGGADAVMTLRLKVDGGGITEIEAVITRSGDWNFSAQGYLQSASQTWDVLPADQQVSYDELTRDAKEYLDYFSSKTTMPPFAAMCTRLEGGASMVDCPDGFPASLAIGQRRYFADVEEGVSASISIFGGASGNLDAHFYRVVSGTIRNVHSMTVNSTFTTTGWPSN